MSSTIVLSNSALDQIRALDACIVSNAIERLGVRLRNEGFASHAVRCRFPHLGPMVGYAVPGRIRTSSTPTSGPFYYDRIDWWSYVASIPAPRVIVMQDSDHTPGFGAWFGEIHASIGAALDCVGYVTNGAVRDLKAVEALDFHLFAGSVAVSHAYAHIVEFGEPVEVGGLKIRPGDLLHGDRHGVQNVPLQVALEIPAIAAQILREEQELIQYCRSAQFSLQGLNERLQRMPHTNHRQGESIDH